MSSEWPDDWRPAPFSVLARYVNGRAFKPEDWGTEGLPIIRIAQITNPNAETNFYAGHVDPRNLIDTGDLIFSWSATLAVMRWSKGLAVLNQHLFKVTPAEGIDRDWLQFRLEASIPDLADEAHGTTMKHIRKGTLSSKKTAVPPLDEQRRIAEVLRSVDDAIAAADAVISGLQSAASEIAERAFADPDAVEVNSDITTFGDLFDIKGGNQPPKSSFVYQPKEGYVRLLQIRDFESDEKAAYISEKSTKARCSEDDILIARYGASVGRILTGKAGAYNVALTKIVFRDNRITRRYAYHWLKSQYFQDRIQAVSNRSAQAGFNKEDLFPTKVVLPPLPVQEDISEVLDDIQEAMRVNREERHQLIALKSALRDDLLSGRVRVPA